MTSKTRMPEQLLYIDGRYQAAADGRCFDSINPANGSVIANVHQAGQADVDNAVASAERGFAAWSAMSAMQRSRVLRNAVSLLRERNDELAALEVLDTGKPIREAIAVDITTGADVIEYYAGLAPTIQGNHQPLSDTSFFYTRREPLGVCAGIGAWNYPIQIACWKSAIALAFGNAMIFKPSEVTPLSALRLAEIYSEAGLPDGVFNVLNGGGETGQMLVEHPRIAKVSFTGSTVTGKKILAGAAANVKEVTLELGGKSPLLVFDDCNLDSAVNGAMLANFFTQGEVCTNGTRVYVHDRIYDDFLDRLATKTAAIVIGDPTDPNTHIGALVSKEHMEKVLHYIGLAKQSGARLVCGGARESRGELANGYFVQPTVFADCSNDMQHARDEIFGPVMSVIRFTDEDQVIDMANDTAYGLAAGIFTQNLARAHRVIAKLQAGICWINTYGDSPAEMPVGGYKHSGIGRENGIDSVRHYTQIKSVFVSLADLGNPFA